MIYIRAIASGSSGNCYLIWDGSTRILIDAGVPVRRIQSACGFRLSDVTGCLISHEHGDHASHAKDLIRYGIDIYTGQGTIDALEGTGSELSGPYVHPVKALMQFRVGSFSVLPFDVEHDAKEPMGFLIQSHEAGEKLLYFTDTYYIKYRFLGIKYLMAECNYTQKRLIEAVNEGTVPAYRIDRLAHSHMSLEALEDMIKANDMSNLKQVWLMHLSKDNSQEDVMKERIQKLTGAEVYVC